MTVFRIYCKTKVLQYIHLSNIRDSIYLNIFAVCLVKLHRLVASHFNHLFKKIAFQYSTWVAKVFPRLGFAFRLNSEDHTIMLVLWGNVSAVKYSPIDTYCLITCWDNKRRFFNLRNYYLHGGKRLWSQNQQHIRFGFTKKKNRTPLGIQSLWSLPPW